MSFINFMISLPPVVDSIISRAVEGLSSTPPKCLLIKYKGVYNYTVRNVFPWLQHCANASSLLKYALVGGMRGGRIGSSSHFSMNAFTRGCLEL